MVGNIPPKLPLWYNATMYAWIVRLVVLFFDIILCWLALARHMASWEDQLFIIVVLSSVLSVGALLLGVKSPRGAVLVFLIKGLLLVFIIMLLPRVGLEIIPILAGFSLVLGIATSAMGMLVVKLFVLGLIGGFWYFYHPVLIVEPHDLYLILGFYVFCIVFSVAVRMLFDTWLQTSMQLEKYRGDVDHLVEVNMELQSFALDIENRTLLEERKRLSREIHDTVGYTLTTLKILFEAAKGLVRKDPPQIEELIEQGLSYTRASLDEIRGAMRGLRASETPALTGFHLVAKLVENFQDVTGMAITVDYTNARGNYGSDIDIVLYKTVQEGLTNAYRHGKASRVVILFQEYSGKLALQISDFGQSARGVIKGIGLKGMEERVSSLGGTVSFEPRDSGFSVLVQLPLNHGADHG